MDVVRLHQYGITYAVATLGTATTPEHLKRIFRLVSEVVFAFDGDRAGRGAAWRALQHALPEAREGARNAFPVPAGRARPGFARRRGRPRGVRSAARRSAEPLSEYLVRALSEEVDLSHADGRARFAEAARPLVEKLPRGIYYEPGAGPGSGARSNAANTRKARGDLAESHATFGARQRCTSDQRNRQRQPSSGTQQRTWQALRKRSCSAGEQPAAAASCARPSTPCFGFQAIAASDHDKSRLRASTTVDEAGN